MRCSRFLLWFTVAIVTSTPSRARAHGGNPAVATLITPPVQGATTSASYPLQWIDSDVSIATGTATVNLFFTPRIPPTFRAGLVPPSLSGEPIVRGIPEADIANEYDWDTTSVPPGNYFIWSRVDEPAVEMSLQIITFAPGILEVQRPGVPRKPWVVVSKPDSPFRFADQEYTLEYRASDPSGTGRVRLEVTRDPNGEGLMTIAEDLPATPTGRFTWRTRELPEGDWLIKATITDTDGGSFSAWGRHFLFVTHLDTNIGDAGLRDAASGFFDAGLSPDAGEGADAGKRPAAKASSCACLSASGSRGVPRAGLALGLVVLGLSVLRTVKPRTRAR